MSVQLELDCSRLKPDQILGVAVRYVTPCLLVVLVFFFLPTNDAAGETWPPVMTFYDEQGTPYTAPDNSTVMQVIPGARITIEVEGMANDLCEVYLSQLSNGAMTGGFLLPPVTRLLSGPPHYLDSQGFASVNVRVPLNFVALGYDLTLYFQADVTADQRPGLFQRDPVRHPEPERQCRPGCSPGDEPRHDQRDRPARRRQRRG